MFVHYAGAPSALLLGTVDATPLVGMALGRPLWGGYYGFYYGIYS